MKSLLETEVASSASDPLSTSKTGEGIHKLNNHSCATINILPFFNQNLEKTKVLTLY
jgi:hypothetical protein